MSNPGPVAPAAGTLACRHADRAHPEQDDVVRRAIAAGRIALPEDAVAQAITDWVERERELADLIASLDEAEAEHRRGGSIRFETEEERRALVHDIVERSQARLTARSTLGG